MSLIDDRAPPELALGMPVTTERFLALGAFRHFQNGSIYASTETDAHVSRNPITAKLHNLGYAAGLLGLPLVKKSRLTSGHRF